MKKRKIILTLSILSVLLISCFIIADIMTLSTKEKLRDRESIKDLRTNLTFRIVDSDTSNLKSYDPLEKIILIEDDKFNDLIELKLTSNYIKYVQEGNDTLIAELTLINWSKDSLFDKINSYNVKKGYSDEFKVFRYKYGVDYLEEECYDLKDIDPELKESVIVCNNVTKTNWIEFNLLSELPNKNIKIGLFTDTTIGEKMEWVPTIEGFEVLEWAEWDVRSGEKHEFDTAEGIYNSLTQIDSTHYLNAYRGVDADGFAVVLTVNTTDWTITSGTKHEFDTSSNGYNSLTQINSTHYLNVYQGVDSDGFAVVLTVNTTDWTITSGTKHEFETSDCYSFSLTQINSTHYLNAYRGVDVDGFAVVLTVNTTDWTITSGTKHEFDTVLNFGNSLTQIDSTHYLNAYEGVDFDGFAVVLTVNTTDWTITSGTKHEFDTDYGNHNSLTQIDSTHYLNVYQDSGSGGVAVVLTVNTTDWTITSGTKHEFETIYNARNSLTQINSTHYLNVYQGVDSDGFAVVLTVNTTDWTITSGTKHEFDTDYGNHNSLTQIDSTHYLTAYRGVDFDGFAVVLNVEFLGAPLVILNAPVDNFKTNSVSITFNCTAIEDISLDSVSLYHDCGQLWGVEAINTTPLNNTATIFIANLLDCTDSIWNCYACNNESECAFASADYTITIDTIAQIEYDSETKLDYANLSQSNIYVDITWTELNLANITFSLYNSTDTINSTTFTTATYDINWTGLPDTNYTYEVNITDTLNNKNSTGIRTITLDNITPDANNTLPLDGTTTNISSHNVTVEISDNYGIKNMTLNIYDYSTGVWALNSTTISYASNVLTKIQGIYHDFYNGISIWFYEIFDWAGNSYTTENYTLEYVSSEHIITNNLNGAYDVFTIDMDNDSDIDIVCASSDDDILLWYENDGLGHFTPHNISTLENAPRSVFAIDMDNDGDIDVINGNVNANTLVIHINNGSESFTSYNITQGATFGFPSSIYAIEMSGPFLPDVISTSYSDDVLSWFESPGSTPATPPLTQNNITSGVGNPNSVFAIDIDGDSYIDILMVDVQAPNSRILWYENDGAESFTEHEISSNLYLSQSVSAVDLNNDSYIDIIASDKHTILWYENDGAESFTVHNISHIRDASFMSVYVADMDYDGDYDIISGSIAGGEISWYENDGAGSFKTHFNITTSLALADDVRAANLDGDNDLDIIVVSGADDYLAWYEIEALPLISYDSETKLDYANLSQSNIYVDITWTELNLANITFSLYNSTDTINSTTFTTATYDINWTGLPDTNYTYEVNITDLSNYKNSTGIRTITLDNITPIMTIVSPANDSSYASTVLITLGYNVSDANLKNCYFTLRTIGGALNNYLENTSLSCTSVSRTIQSLYYGTFVVQLWGEDYSGNLGDANLTWSSYTVLGGGGGGGGGGVVVLDDDEDDETEKSFCGDGICQPEGNDYGIIENWYTCNSDCPGVDLDEGIYSFTKYCFDDDPLTFCFFESLFSIGGAGNLSVAVCGDGVCEPLENPWNCEADCGKFSLKSIIGCFDTSEDTYCIFKSNISYMFFFIMGSLSLMFLMVKVKSPESNKKISINNYIKLKIKKRRRRR